MYFILAILWIWIYPSQAQVSTEPAFPTEGQSVKIIFDATKGNQGLMDYTGDVYAHTGVITDKSTGDSNWRYVIADWNVNIPKAKMTRTANNLYELEITPGVREFYGVPAEESIEKMAFVFRSHDRTKEGKAQGNKDIFIELFEGGLEVNLESPENNSIFEPNETIAVLANASQAGDLKLYLNGNKVAEVAGTQIQTNLNIDQAGTHLIVAEITVSGNTASDSVQVLIRENVIQNPKPSAYKKGINYLSDNSVALVLWAPLKEYVFVLGDFNDWQANNDYQMKRDGDYFWLEINELEKNREYAFQYLIDGDIKIADPYTEKTLNPWHDKDIPAESYPNLRPYPENKTEGIVSVLQTGQTPYQWEVENFVVPDQNKLVIYELLVRDFTEQQTYKAVREKLDYLEDLRVNVLELMPVNEFEGNLSWGYNSSFYFAPDKYYGPKDELKKLIDECHKRGIAVVIDMVLNHSYGQSPFVQMYMDNWVITEENPWYNIESPNNVYSWGFDFDHEAKAVEELMDSVNSFWIYEYKIDGFRFDFTKGFTNTPGDGWAYDAPRIENLKRMANEVWKRKPDALVILEHLADNREEKELAEHGMLLWGNMHGSYQEAAKGNVSGSDLTWGLYNERGWSKANLVAYPESHDEQRIMYTLKQSGYSNGDYNIKDQSTALDRIELNSAFYFPLPGPRMIWQFEERGYDVSIDAFGGRTDEKPPYWHYLDDSDRTDLFQVIAKLNELKQTYPEFEGNNFTYNLKGSTKWYQMSEGGEYIIMLGNFDISHKNISVTFPETGKWYEFFSRDSINISLSNQTYLLSPGEYRLYSTRRINDPDVVTEIDDPLQMVSESDFYPNPSQDRIWLKGNSDQARIIIYSLEGKLVSDSYTNHLSGHSIDISNLTNGLYIVNIVQETRAVKKKLIIN